MITNLLIIIWSFLISVFGIPSIIFVAHKKSILDEPKDRTIHETSTPRLGGLAIFAGFISALSIFGSFGSGIQFMIAGCVIIFFIGLKDDIVSVSAFKKFFVQILAAGIVLLLGDIRITSFQGFLGIYELKEGISFAFSFLVIVGLTNAINLLDGLDGLAGTIIAVIATIFGIYFFIYGGEKFYVYSFVSFALVGSVLGFLRYNFTKAQIFMGDTGSLVCGFIISVLAIKFIEMRPVESTTTLSMAILFIPIFDTARVFGLRILSGKSPFAPDKNHLHHRLLELGLGQVQVVLILTFLNLLVFGFAFFLDSYGLDFVVGIIIAFTVAVTVVLELVFNARANSKGYTKA
ncbi:MAG: undecaprenyl/decaprenyl-phosphate alpha-N-acetylglucosaminyl 1-phosphate transferase [Cytophagales bacterium]|nr:undecaprenyl/decaprenyl-phosphate alpha-N-acetylglucosaminyl 1-phosphate transferase [Cytophagales bacterium]